jgi:hypothetical protein
MYRKCDFSYRNLSTRYKWGIALKLFMKQIMLYTFNQSNPVQDRKIEVQAKEHNHYIRTPQQVLQHNETMWFDGI